MNDQQLLYCNQGRSRGGGGGGGGGGSGRLVVSCGVSNTPPLYGFPRKLLFVVVVDHLI